MAAAAGHTTTGARVATAGRDRQLARRALVVVQIALALTLLVRSGLAVRSFQRLAAVDPGFNPAGVLTFGLAPPLRDYETAESRLDFHRQVVDRLGALPGVAAAASATTISLGGELSGSEHTIEGRPLADGEVPPVFMWRRVSPGYFDALGMELVEGRVFDALDGERDAPVVIVSRALAQVQWPGVERARQGNSPGRSDGRGRRTVVPRGRRGRRRPRGRAARGPAADGVLLDSRGRRRHGRPARDVVRGARPERRGPRRRRAGGARARSDDDPARRVGDLPARYQS